MRIRMEPSLSRKKARSNYRSFRNYTLQKPKLLNLSKSPQILIRQNTQAQNANTEAVSNTCQSSVQLPNHRFTSASTNRETPSLCTSFKSSARIKPLSKPTHPSPQIMTLNPSVVKISEMLSTMATTIPEKKAPNLSAHCYCVMMASSKKVLLGGKMDTRRQVASLTKLMTAMTVMEIARKNAIDITAGIVVVGEEAAMMEGTSAGLILGDQMRVMDLLHGMLLPSGNDAAIALANHFGKIISETVSFQLFNQSSLVTSKDYVKLFVGQMNKLASELGLKNTYFQNPTGLQHQKSYSTAYDMALLSQAFSNNTILKNITQKKTYHYDVFNRRLCTRKSNSWRNTNTLLWRRKDCKGLKTGTTPWAGFCLSSIFRVKHMEVIVVVLKCASPDERFNDAEKLYLWFKSKYLF